MNLFSWFEPVSHDLPIVLSVPHAGTYFPHEIREQIAPQLLPSLDDTDWFVDRLYDFAAAMGIPLLRANYHRWVIDLNRSPDHKPLYTDGRVITGLCTTTDFLGNPIYRDQRTHVQPEDVEMRKLRFFEPYHAALHQRLEATKKQFGVVLLWDCHSIRRYVPAIHTQPFPDLILGSADGTSASTELIETTLRLLRASGREMAHNFPFKGGYITRHYGKPFLGVHALQLEMSKVNYMNDAENEYDSARAAVTANLLRSTLRGLAEVVAKEANRFHV